MVVGKVPVQRREADEERANDVAEVGGDEGSFEKTEYVSSVRDFAFGG